LLAVIVTPANEQDRAQVGELARQIQEVTDEAVEIAFVDQGYTGDRPAADAQAHGIRLEVVKLPTAKHGFVLLPRRWVVERSFAWMARFRRLVRDCERLSETLVGLHFVAFAMLMAHRFVTFMAQSAKQTLAPPPRHSTPTAVSSALPATTATAPYPRMHRAGRVR
jgi:transposase